jgi:hypothetical protein
MRVQETLTGLWESGYWIFGALAALLLLTDLIALAVGRRMLNPRRLTDRAYARQKRRLVQAHVLDHDATYEPKAVGTPVGYVRSIQGRSLIVSAEVGAVVTIACLGGAFLIPIPSTVNSSAAGLHLAVGFWLALSFVWLSLLIGGRVGYRIATRRVRSIPPEESAAISTEEAARARVRPHFVAVLFVGIVIAADIVVTLLFRREATSTSIDAGTAERMWLLQLLLVAPLLMVLSLALCECIAFLESRRHPLLLSPDVALAMRASTWLREQAVQACRGSMAVAVALLIFGQYGVVSLMSLSLLNTPDHSDVNVTVYELAYIILYLVCAVVGGYLRLVASTNDAESTSGVNTIPSRPAFGNAIP